MDVRVPDLRRGPWSSMFTKILEATKLKKARVYGEFQGFGSRRWNMDDHTDVRRASGTLIGRYLVGEGGISSLEDFVTEERLRISEEDGESSVSDDDLYY